VETPLTREDALLTRYIDLVRRWAPRIDIVGNADLDRLRARHVDDSLRPRSLFASLPYGPVADVGSGGGFPGIPLAIALPDRHFRLLEPRAKRAAFLEEVVRALDLDCEVLRITAEEAARLDELARAHVVATARAVAPPERAFELLAPLVAPGGVAVVWHGARTSLPEMAEEWAEGIAIVRS
jgi:16S rRNA (guanine527-N7)-methyltransferase